jgi:hypothetical protein
MLIIEILLYVDDMTGLIRYKEFGHLLGVEFKWGCSFHNTRGQHLICHGQNQADNASDAEFFCILCGHR